MVTAAIAALTLVGGYLGRAAISHADALSDLELANAEALAQVEAYSIPCLLAKEHTCVFDVRLPDGTIGTMTVEGMIHIFHTIH